MIVNHLSRLFGERRLNIAEGQRQTGLSYGTLWDLYRGKSTRVDIKTLDKLCTALGVGVGDILEYRPDDA